MYVPASFSVTHLTGENRRAFRSPTPMVRPCRILIIIGELVAGGSEQQLCYLLQEMDRERFSPVVVVWNYSESDVNVAKMHELGIPLWGYPLTTSSRKKLYLLARLARMLRPEVVHSFSFYTNVAAFCAARASGAIAVGSLRSAFDFALRDCGSILGRASALLPQNQICNSHSAGQALRDAKWVGPKRVSVVPNGLDLQRFRRAPAAGSPPFCILGVGSLIPVKRWDRLLVVAQELKRRQLPCIVQIAGDGPLRSELETLAERLDVQDVTQFLGYRNDIPDLLARAHVVVHTSDTEGSANAIMEALAAGRPVIATDVGDAARLIEHGKSGFIVPPDDSDALLKHIIDIISDEFLAHRLGEAGWSYARREFSLSRFVEKTLDAYRSAGWDRREVERTSRAKEAR